MATYAPTVIAATTGVLEYVIGFDYADKTHIKVYVDDVEVAFGFADAEWLLADSGTKIAFVNTFEPQTGSTIIIKRLTDISEALVLFVNGAGLTQIDINAAIAQLLLAVDELQVAAFETGFLAAADLVGADIVTPHNLGGVPTRTHVTLKCTSTDAGYAANDQAENVGLVPLAVVWSATECRVLSANAEELTVWHKTTGISTTIDPAKWSYRVQAWR